MSTPATRFSKEVQADINRRVQAGMSVELAEQLADDKAKQSQRETRLRLAWEEFTEHNGREAALAAIARSEEVHCPNAAEWFFSLSEQVEGMGL